MTLLFSNYPYDKASKNDLNMPKAMCLSKWSKPESWIWIPWHFSHTRQPPLQALQALFFVCESGSSSFGSHHHKEAVLCIFPLWSCQDVPVKSGPQVTFLMIKKRKEGNLIQFSQKAQVQTMALQKWRCSLILYISLSLKIINKCKPNTITLTHFDYT